MNKFQNIKFKTQNNKGIHYNSIYMRQKSYTQRVIKSKGRKQLLWALGNQKANDEGEASNSSNLLGVSF
jgi:hypothetical protein